MFKFFIFLLLFAFSKLTLAETAIERANLYFADMQDGNYELMVGHFHPDDLKEFRQLMSFYKDYSTEQQRDFFLNYFGGYLTTESVDRMSDEEFVGLILDNVMSVADEVIKAVSYKVDLIGDVAESEELVHVVARINLKSQLMEAEDMEVLSLRKFQSGWRVVMPVKVKSLADQLRGY